MALNNVSLVYSYFADPEKSQAISEGDAYVGNPDTDPEIGGNQKQVYHRQENGSDVPVSQPLKTGAGGVILINGSPAQIVVDGNYSIKVLDKSGAQKYYDPNRYDGVPVTTDSLLEVGIGGVNTVSTDLYGFDISNIKDNDRVYAAGYYASGDGGGGPFYWNASSSDADDGGFTTVLPAGYGGVGRFKRIVIGAYDVRMGGAKGDGTTDNLTVFNNLRDAFPEGTWLQFPSNEVFACSAAVEFAGAWTIDGNGSTLLLGGTFSFINPVYGSNTLTSDAGTSSFDIGTVPGLESGDIFILESDELWPYDNRGTLHYGELGNIAYISGTTAYVGTPEYAGELYFSDKYTTALNGRAKYYKQQTLYISNLEVKGNGTLDKAMICRGYSDLSLENISIYNCSTSGFEISECFNPTVVGSRIENISPAGSIGYGVNIYGCTNATVTESAFNACRRGVDFSGDWPSIAGGVYGCYADACGGNTGSAFGTHGTAYMVNFEGNELGRNQYGFLMRGLNCAVKDNICKQADINFVHATYGAGLNITGNRLEKGQAFAGFYTDYIDAGTDSSEITMNSTVLHGNHANGLSINFVRFDVTSTQKILYGYVFKDNIVQMAEGSGFRAAIAGIDGSGNRAKLTGYTMDNGCAVQNNYCNASATIPGRYLHFVDDELLFSGNSSVDAVTLSQITTGTPTISTRTGAGTISNVSVISSYVNREVGHNEVQAIYEFTLSGGSTNGIVLSHDWIEVPQPSNEGRYNPLYYQVGIGPQSVAALGFSNAITDTNLSIGYGVNNGIDGTFADGTYQIYLLVDVINQAYNAQRPN